MEFSKNTLQKRACELGKLTYKTRPFASRNWGHPWHSLISYPSKLKPAIAHFLVKLFSCQDDVVLDPFSGVGTIPFEAGLQQRNGWGSDLSPLAFHATRAKVEQISSNRIEELLLKLEQFILDSEHESDCTPVEPEIIQYYHPRTLSEILAARRFFQNLNSRNPEASFLLTCMLHILHGNRPYALSRRSHNIMPWSPKGEFVYKSVLASLADKTQRMLSFVPRNGFKPGFAFQDNAAKLGVKDESIDVILTSPPFHSSRDFLRMNRIRLWFCGWSYNHQQMVRENFLEHQKDLGVYSEIFREFNRVLKPQSAAVLHLGVVGAVDMATNITPFARKAGFDHIATVYEDTSRLENHGIRDLGATHKHQFLVLRKS